MDKILAQIINRGMAAGEFRAGDPELAAILVRSACVRFCHPGLMVQCAQEPEPTIDQMIDFCLAGLANKPQNQTWPRLAVGGGAS
jgi:hypothetical protein